MSVIEIDNMTFGYNEHRKVLKDINISIEENQCVGLIGANGAGKSTLLKLLVGLEGKYEGEIKINDLQVIKKNLAEVRKEVGYVFQDSESQLFLSTIYDDIAFGPKNYGFSKEEVERRVDKAIEMVGIKDIKNRHTYMTSGGQKKLASIATILAMEPNVILLDEPSIALDPRNRRNLINIINKLPGTKIIASHDLDMILDTCDRTILISNNQVVADGVTNEILNDKQLLEDNGLELPLILQK